LFTSSRTMTDFISTATTPQTMLNWRARAWGQAYIITSIITVRCFRLHKTQAPVTYGN